MTDVSELPAVTSGQIATALVPVVVPGGGIAGEDATASITLPGLAAIVPPPVLAEPVGLPAGASPTVVKNTDGSYTFGIPAGAIPTLSATASQLPSTSAPTVTVTGPVETPNFEFGIPVGTTPALSATASSVAPGGQPTVTVTGTITAPVFNLGLPTGSPGTVPTFTAAATPLAAGAAPTATVTGNSATPLLTVGIPAGPTGPTGQTGPAIVQSILTILGGWNASTNTPTLVSSTGTANTAYFVTTAGTTTLNGNSTWAVNDLVAFVNGAWTRLPGYVMPSAVSNLTVSTQAALPNKTVQASTVTTYAEVTSDSSGLIMGYKLRDGSAYFFGASGAMGPASFTSTKSSVGPVSYSISALWNGKITTDNSGLVLVNASDASFPASGYVSPLGNASGISVTGQTVTGTTSVTAPNKTFAAGVSNYAEVTTDKSGLIVGYRLYDGSQYSFGASGQIGYFQFLTTSLFQGKIVSDSSGLVIENYSSLSFPGLAQSSFTQSEIDRHNALNLARSQQIRDQPNIVVQLPVCNYNGVLGTGQSEYKGFQSLPALSTTQPFDNLSVGTTPMGSTIDANAVWSPIGNAGFNPFVGVVQLQEGVNPVSNPSTIATFPNVTFNLATLTIALSGSVATFTTMDSVNFAAQFAVGNYFNVGNLTGAAAVNNGLAFQITAVTATTITATAPTGAVAMATSQAAQIIIVWIYTSSYNGEGQIVQANNFWRRLQLRGRCLSADSTRLLVVNDVSVSGQTLAALSPGATPNIWAKVGLAITAQQAAATALGKTYCLSVVEFGQGGSDAQAATPTSYATYQSELAAYNTAVIAEAQSITGQAAPPLFEMFQLSTDNALQTSAQGIPQAQLDYATGNAPGQNGVPPSNVVLVGPMYGVPAPNYGEHKSINAERAFGCIRGKVRHKIMDLGQGWMPLMPTLITARGDVILIDFHVPEPPLQWKPIYLFNELVLFGTQNGQTLTPLSSAITYNGGNAYYTLQPGGVGGFIVNATDGGVAPVIQSATIISDTSVLLQLNRSMPAGYPPIVGYGDRTNTGRGNLFDSDPMMSDVTYQWVAGNGAPNLDDYPSLIGTQFSLANACVLFFKQAVAG